ncbi:MAG: hypothetical protein WBL67_06420 [Nitrososphaeraceae archaeon]
MARLQSPFIPHHDKRFDTDISLVLIIQLMTHRQGTKTKAYTERRSASKKYAKAERRKRNKIKA